MLCDIHECSAVHPVTVCWRWRVVHSVKVENSRWTHSWCACIVGIVMVMIHYNDALFNGNMSLSQIPDLIFCPGCYTKPPSGTMQTFWRTFSMGRSWSTYLNFTSNYPHLPHSMLEYKTYLNIALPRYLNSCDSWGRSPVHAAATTESSMCLRILVQVLSTPGTYWCWYWLC